MDVNQEALRSGKAALGEFYFEISKMHNRIGNFYFKREYLDKAINAYREGLRIE